MASVDNNEVVLVSLLENRAFHPQREGKAVWHRHDDLGILSPAVLPVFLLVSAPLADSQDLHLVGSALLVLQHFIDDILEFLQLDLRHTKECRRTLGIFAEGITPEFLSSPVSFMEKYLRRSGKDDDDCRIDAADIPLPELVKLHAFIRVRRLLRIHIHSRRHRHERPHGSIGRLAISFSFSALLQEILDVSPVAVLYSNRIPQRNLSQPVNHKIIRPGSGRAP